MLYLLLPAAQIFFVIHAARTGRPYYWMMIIFFIPLMGMLAYIAIELLPEMSRSPTASRTVSNAKQIVNPEGNYRVLTQALEITPTAGNKRALADECVRLGKYDEAEALYRDALTGIHATDPYTMLGLARALFAQGDAARCVQTLDALRADNPGFQNAEGHMLYARSLEALGQNERALMEYEALGHYFGGEEPRVRHALLLKQTGNVDAARVAFTEIKRSVERAPAFYRRNQREWYRVAADNLKS
ncbi:MAG TPA: tetratricopeptide repeat protein [Alphaproteobacteria bacterium]|nr:tetratricopeptide repeat protein [Alphaproteobacteria bacterium]